VIWIGFFWETWIVIWRPWEILISIGFSLAIEMENVLFFARQAFGVSEPTGEHSFAYTP
jgi:hypothetical protein